MSPPAPLDITGLLRQWIVGDAAALERLKPLVHDQLQRLAESFMQNERSGHTLGATALAHETYLKLIDAREVHWRDHGHSFEEAANIMRRVDDARKSEHSADEDVLALDQALAKLSRDRQTESPGSGAEILRGADQQRDRRFIAGIRLCNRAGLEDGARAANRSLWSRLGNARSPPRCAHSETY